MITHSGLLSQLSASKARLVIGLRLHGTTKYRRFIIVSLYTGSIQSVASVFI